MNDIKNVVAGNIALLRQENGMTQLELAEKLNYSDKAVSKWERAESLPDISVLAEMSRLFGVSLDYLIEEDHEKKEPAKSEPPPAQYSRTVITAVSVLLVWLIAVFAYVVIALGWKNPAYAWLCFVYAVPLSSIVWLVFNCVWFNPRRNYVIISLLMWSTLASLHLSLKPFGVDARLLYLPGVPGQLIIVLWSIMKKGPKQK